MHSQVIELQKYTQLIYLYISLYFSWLLFSFYPLGSFYLFFCIYTQMHTYKKYSLFYICLYLLKTVLFWLAGTSSSMDCMLHTRYKSCFLTYIQVCILAQRDSLKGVFENFYISGPFFVIISKICLSTWF